MHSRVGLSSNLISKDRWKTEMKNISRIRCSLKRRNKTALRKILALKSARRKKYCIRVLHRKKKQSCANLQLIKYMNGMKAKKCEQTRMQLCDRRYLEIEHVNNFISQRLQVLERVFKEEAFRINIES